AWLVWGLFSLVILAGVLLGHWGGVGRHVDRLLQHMQRVAAGDLSYRAALDGPAEVASLAAGLNRMLDAIAEANRELDAHRRAETQLLARIKDNEKMVAIGSIDRKSTRLNSSHVKISYAVFCLKKKNKKINI